MKRTLLTGYALLFCTVSVLSQTQQTSIQKTPEINAGIQSEKLPASITRAEKDGNVLFSFELLTSPEQELFDRSLESFRKIEGFVSLSVNERNVVEVITKPSVSDTDNSRILMISARMYGYLGFKISA